MAEPLSIGASIVAFIQVAEGVIRASSFCIDAIQDAPTDLQMILCEVTSVKFIVAGFNRPEWHESPHSTGFLSKLFARSGPVDACKRCLSALEDLLPSEAKQGSSPMSLIRNGPGGKGHRRISLAQLAWPFKQSKARKLLAELSHHKATLLLAISGDIAHDLKEIQTALSRLSDVVSASDKREIFRWLEQTNPSTMHNNNFRKHEPHTSMWLLGLDEWKNWLDPVHTQGSLWIHGPPGTGKTVMASFIIETLAHHCENVLASDNGIKNHMRLAYSYYYCHYSHDQDESVPFLSWNLSQACRQTGWIPGELKRLFDRGQSPGIPDLERCLEIVLDKLDVFYVVIDAVDESNPRWDLINLIATLVLDTRFRKIRILATSRPYFEIERVFSGVFGSVVSMSNPSVEADIRNMVRSRLASSYRLKRWKDWHPSIENILVSRSGGMFQWVECQMRTIERLRDISQLEETLRNLPADLAETYTRILQEIPVADREFVRRVLIWVISHANAPWISDWGIDAELLVSAAEFDLCGGKKRGPSPFENEFGGMYTVECLKELCACLLTFKVDVADPEADNTSVMSDTTLIPGSDDTPATNSKQKFAVSVSHYTVVEFLESAYILTNPSTAFFSLTPFQIRYEFARSVFRQALSATPAPSIPDADNPTSLATDWDTDREAYCLTLACATSFMDQEYLGRDINSGEADELVDLVLQYFNPFMPHFGRFKGIQRRIALDPMVSGIYYLSSLPSGFVHEVSTPPATNGSASGYHIHERSRLEIAAKTLACILSLPWNEYKVTLLDRCVTRLVQWAGVSGIEELMEVKVKGFRTVRNWYHPDLAASRSGLNKSRKTDLQSDEDCEGGRRTYTEVWFEETIGQLRTEVAER
ncbi:hypothetical protein V8F20_002720 [Naviculisporaceae sp. PSN 640]